MKSIYLRNFVANAVLVSVCFLILAFSFVGIGRDYVISEYQENMESNAREVSHMVSSVVQYVPLDSLTIGMTLSTISNSTGNQIFITDITGRIINCSDREPMCSHMGFVVSSDVLYETYEKGFYNQITNLGGLYAKTRYVVAMPVLVGEENILVGFIFVTNVIDNMLGAWSSFLSIGISVTVAVFIAALLMSLLYSKRMAKPLDEMAAASRKFARGDFSVRVRQADDPTDEMGALIESFNKMADSLEQAEEHRSEFIANVSHELRTPMTTIAGFADGILDGTISRDEQDKYLRSIRDETQRLSRLVRDMLDLSQTRARVADVSKRSIFDINELVVQTLLSFESRAMAKNLDVDPQLPDNHVMVFADKDAITQVVYNLLDNAIKFAHENTCITLRLYRDNDKAYVSIKDIGETIPPDDLPFIFDRFHKSDRSRSLDKTGVGLGLYLVKTIINSHDEDIAVKSEDGVTEFVFTLALA